MRILIASSTEKSLDGLSLLIKEIPGAILSKSLSADTARRMLLDEEFDLVVINYPLSDEPGEALAKMARDSVNVPSLFIIRDDLKSLIGRELEKEGFIVISKPILKPILLSAINLAESVKQRDRFMEEKIRKLEMKLDEQKFISRAKCLLIEKRKMSEINAHKYIEKIAMDKRIPLKAAAMTVIKDISED